MTFKQILAVLRARWWVALGIAILILSMAVVYVLITPKSYVATASVLVDVKNADPIAGMVSPSVATPAFLVTQVDIIKSKRVALKVIRNMRLQESDQMRQRWREDTHSTGDFQGWMASLLQASLDAHPSRGSNVIYVNYKAADPRFAAAVANGFVQAYLQTVLELRTMPARQSKDFLDATAKEAREQLEAAQDRLSAYQRNQDLVVTDERLDVETAKLNELTQQVVQAQAAEAESSSRQDAALRQGDKSPDVASNPLITQLKADLIRQQTALEQAITKLGEAHPQVVEMRSGIADTTRKLDIEITRISRSVGVGNHVNVARLAQLRQLQEAQRNKVLQLKDVRDQAAILQRDVDNAQRAYDGILARTNTMMLESQVNQANVSPLEAAVAPAIPASPRVGLTLALGMLMAMVLAIAGSLLVETLDRRFRVEEESEWMLQVPVVGHLPSYRKLMSNQAKGSTPSLSLPAIRALPAKG